MVKPFDVYTVHRKCTCAVWISQSQLSLASHGLLIIITILMCDLTWCDFCNQYVICCPTKMFMTTWNRSESVCHFPEGPLYGHVFICDSNSTVHCLLDQSQNRSTNDKKGGELEIWFAVLVVYELNLHKCTFCWGFSSAVMTITWMTDCTSSSKQCCWPLELAAPAWISSSCADFPHYTSEISSQPALSSHVSSPSHEILRQQRVEK